MTIIQKFKVFFKKKNSFISLFDAKNLKIQKFNPLIIISFLVVFSIVFFVTSNLINKKNKSYEKNLKEITKTNEFISLKNFLTSKINSPYEEIEYIIQNNDTVEKILKNFKVRNEDIKKISVKLKQKKLVNIYSGRKLSLIIKKLDNGSKTVVSFLYPINNTSSVEIRKSQNDFLVKENILQLYKKEVVIKKYYKK